MVAVAADPPTRLARTHPTATATPTRLSHDRVNISVLPLTPGYSTRWVLHRVLASSTNSTPRLVVPRACTLTSVEGSLGHHVGPGNSLFLMADRSFWVVNGRRHLLAGHRGHLNIAVQVVRTVH